jgi:purine-binding chemotaxis protein CheW
VSVHVRFRVGGGGYALPVAKVLEVAEVGLLAPVPGAPEPVQGVRNLHGQVLAVVDLAAALGLKDDRRALRLLIVESEGRRAALAVDEVVDVGELPHEEGEELLDLEEVFQAVEARAAA